MGKKVKIQIEEPLSSDEEKIIDLYEILGVTKETLNKDIKRAYYKLALKHHPDKQPTNLTDEQKEIIKDNFQNIGLAYSVLSDEIKKERYDRTGSWQEGGVECSTFEEWTDYFEIMFGSKVTKDSIAKFELEYKGSEEEINDVIKAYQQGKGSMDKILDSVMLAGIEDEDRFQIIIDKAIKDKELELIKQYTSTTTDKAKKLRKKRAIQEAEEAEEAEKELLEKEVNKKRQRKENDNGIGGLAQLIRAKQAEREAGSDAFFDNLAAKYANKNGPKSKKAKVSKKPESKNTSKKNSIKK